MANPSLVLTPTGGSPVELNDGTIGRVAMDGLELPVPVYEESYADSALSEGGALASSKPSNAVARVGMFLRDSRGASYFNANRHVWQQLIEACRRNGGELTYTPRNGTAVTYVIESARITEMPVSDIEEAQFFGRSTAEFTCRPWGKLAKITSYPLTTDAGVGGQAYIESSLPVLSGRVDDVPGSVPALCEWSVIERSSQNRSFVDAGFTPWNSAHAALPVIVDSDSWTPEGPATATTRTGAYDPNASGNNVIRTPALGLTPQYFASYNGANYDVGPFRAKARLYGVAATGLYVTLAYFTGTANPEFLPWTPLPALADWIELDLGLIWGSPEFGEAFFYLLGYDAVGASGRVFDFDYLMLYPADQYGKCLTVSGDWDYSLSSGVTNKLTSQRYQTAGGRHRWEGGLPRLDPGDNRFAFRARRTNVAAGGSAANISDTLRVSLDLTPRVALLSS